MTSELIQSWNIFNVFFHKSSLQLVRQVGHQTSKVHISVWNIHRWFPHNFRGRVHYSPWYIHKNPPFTVLYAGSKQDRWLARKCSTGTWPSSGTDGTPSCSWQKWRNYLDYPGGSSCQGSILDLVLSLDPALWHQWWWNTEALVGAIVPFQYTG